MNASKNHIAIEFTIINNCTIKLKVPEQFFFFISRTSVNHHFLSNSPVEGETLGEYQHFCRKKKLISLNYGIDGCTYAK